MSDIFLSYSSQDRDRIQPLIQAFEQEGFSVWWDRAAIPPGKTFDEVIDEALTNSRCAVVVWSATSAVSRWVKTEASDALSNERLFPVQIDDVTIPLEFRRLQTTNLIGWTGDKGNPEYQLLINAIKLQLGTPVESTPSPAPRTEPVAPVPQPAPTPEPVVSAAEPAPVEPQPPASGHPPPAWLRPAIYLLAFGLIGLLIAYTAISQPAEFPRDQMRLGLVLKTKWQPCEARQYYTLLLNEINRRFEERGMPYRFADSDPIKTFVNTDGIVKAVNKGQVQVIGELSPYDLYKTFKGSNAQPFTSPSYSNETHYNAVFFVSSGYKSRNGGDLWSDVLKRISEESDNRIALFNESSTSGYWYPRDSLISGIQMSGKNINDIIATHNRNEDIYDAVASGGRGVIAGAIAKFRFCPKKKDKNGTRVDDAVCLSKFKEIKSTKPIPNGGFALHPDLHNEFSDNGQIGMLQSAWYGAAKTLNRKKADVAAQVSNACNTNNDPAYHVASLPSYIVPNWTEVDSDHYKTAWKIFGKQAEETIERNSRTRKLTIVGAIIALFVALGYLFIKLRSHRP